MSRDFLEALPFGVLHVDPVGLVRWASGESLRLLGVSDPGAVPVPISALLDSDLAGERAYLDTSRSKTYAQRFVERDVVPVHRSAAATVILSLSLSRASDDPTDGYLALLRDVSAERLEQGAMEKAADIIERRLEDENRRKSAELEKARALQQAMLPVRMPEHPAFDVAARLATAVEVGGDYYDFIPTDDGFLALVGDATGHGLEAGMMVTVTKSVVMTMGPDLDPVAVLQHVNGGLLTLRLPKLYMCLAAMRIRPESVEMASAGIPPVFVFRKETGQVEEIRLKGLMLGAAAGLPYERTRVTVSPGDQLVAMSDGFPERFNRKHEELGYDRAPDIIRQACPCSSEDLLDALMAEAEHFSGGEPLNDDMTLLAVRFR